MGGLRAVGEALARAAGLGGRPFLPRARAWVARPRVEGRGSWRPGAVPEGTKGLALALVRCPQPTSGSEMPFACVAKRRLVVVIPLQASRSQSLREKFIMTLVPYPCSTSLSPGPVQELLWSWVGTGWDTWSDQWLHPTQTCSDRGCQWF